MCVSGRNYKCKKANANEKNRKKKQQKQKPRMSKLTYSEDQIKRNIVNKKKYKEKTFLDWVRE